MTTPRPSSPSPGRSSKILSPEAGKEGFVHCLFDRISPGYDLCNRLTSVGLDQLWRRRAVDGLTLVPGMRVLDCASGTGDLAAMAAARIVPLGWVVAYDLSGQMLRSAQRKFRRSPAALWHIRPAQGRAEALPFLPGSFDAATMGFALRNVSDLKAVFREFHRVLRPGGRIGVLEFGRPRNPLLRLGHLLWLTTAVPLLGWLTTWTLWPFLYLRRSILQFMEPRQVAASLEEAGFSQVKAEPLHGGIVILYTALR